MIVGFPVPDFDFDDTQIIPMPKDLEYHCRSASPCSDGVSKECFSFGFSISPSAPLRCTGNSLVFSARQTDGGQPFALKISASKSRITEEYSKRKSIPDSVYLVKSYNVFETAAHAILQMELCQSGDMTGKKLTEEQTWQLIHDIGSAMTCIHKAGWMHLDISPSNILYDGSIFKLADFGTLVQIGQFVSGREGAGPYVSPEALAFPNGDYQVGPETDIFSFGVVILECASNQLAPRGGSIAYTKIRNNELHLGEGNYFCSMSSELISLVNRMLSFDPSLRPSAEELANHPLAIANGGPASN